MQSTTLAIQLEGRTGRILQIPSIPVRLESVSVSPARQRGPMAGSCGGACVYGGGPLDLDWPPPLNSREGIMRMNKKTLEALHGSVRKWDRICRDARAKNLGEGNCPLCALFKKCSDCPVVACMPTPYGDWAVHSLSIHKRYHMDSHREPHCKECLTLAKAERAFLVSLLPKKERGRWA